MEAGLKTVAYIGLSGPIGYDYSDDDQGHPILENVSGLAICYDEIVFLSRGFCPADMRDLSFVRFLDEEVSTSELGDVVARGAITEMRRLMPDPVESPFEGWNRWYKAMLPSMPGRRIDNHNRGLFVGDDIAVSGNSMVLENGLADLASAELLSDRRVDVILPSPLQRVLRPMGPPELDDDYFSKEKLLAAEELVGIRSPNALSALGGYSETVDQIRDHDLVREFRSYLREREAGESTGYGLRLAESIQREAMTVASERLRKERGAGSLMWGLGAPAVGMAGSVLFPPLGGALSSVAKAIKARRERASSEAVSWAPFVLEMTSEQWGR